MKLYPIAFLIFLLFYGCGKEVNIKKDIYQSYADFIEFDSTFFDFGPVNIPEEGINHTFILRNNSKDTMTIYNVLLGCDCMRVNYFKDTILPYDTVHVSINYQSYQKEGFEKTISILFNEGAFCSYFGISGIAK